MQNLGYDVSRIEAEYYLDLVSEACQALENNEDEEVIELIPRFYIEYGHFIYEGLGVKNFIKRVDDFYHSIDPSTQNRSLHETIYGKKTPSVEESILLIAKYTNQMNQIGKMKIKS